MQLIATFLLVLAAALSNAQSLSGSTAPPKGCEVCNTFIGQMQTCKTTAAPASEAQWVDTATKLAACICPVFASANSDTCSICIQTTDPTSPATKLFFKLKQDCFTGAMASTAVDIASIFNVTVNANSIPVSPSSTANPPANSGTTVPKQTRSSAVSIYTATLSSIVLSSLFSSLLFL
ncbi:hypothetical protein BATDEDRAFT_86695 [Batrachochytrium dendrobatidis JAM81]|uniref:Uncharacterized protein n=2 Tax=Batrachochytrium dendrobatidis TaxID=109871 RepID=F4NWS6_BATDJ|nr:uncharacterized protein BATDEDRAFT_86695 [Batrachochytrium dendrobatidis JAM81]EGF82538.1 hypothetical protein BATDEDRAFT_86695 [Batrachochytrium dendrobatidis JAM81]KAJ8327924.1 hypothetical protein O5D80_003313 [Batrachochytrium dendrobatidis]KAK5667131.1 hypothetical protein QVD99_006342 [Batrachochytrium dendrobatidis]OAJ39426.1 hypothetical protein BDEG_23275 [Batrachochytrium dendrobatidis JEL423]|eukprot:XP_006676961.1 hypothetical protein BATDEDRAFT_86695 [Batrachochytrium dendrobatidis JAM81]